MVCPKCGAVVTSSPRSRPQQNAFHKLVRAYANATGEPFDLVKTKWKFHIGEWVEIPIDPDKLAAWKSPPWPGDIIDTGGVHVYHGRQIPVFVFLRSEADYTKELEAKLIDHALHECGRVDADISWMDS